MIELDRFTVPGPRRWNEVGALPEFEALAARRLPRAIFAFARAGVEAEESYCSALAAFGDWRLVPRVLQGGSEADISTEIMGRRYAAPFGIAPMGGAALCHFRGDEEFALSASEENVPFLISGASSLPMEELRRKCPTAWMQVYMPADPAAAQELCDRIARAGFEDLVVTVDVPVGGNRMHYARFGFSQPLSLTWRLAADGGSRPIWLADVVLRTLLKQGIPHFENNGASRGPPIVGSPPMHHMRAKLGWEAFRRIRDQWRGRLVIKGVLSPIDARLARDAGADGVIVSGHGGRQLDGAIAPLKALPAIAAAVPDFPVMLDGGVRWGGDAIKALALGARFVFVGRPLFYANALGGTAAVTHGLRLLKSELARNMIMAGLDKVDQITPDILASA